MIGSVVGPAVALALVGRIRSTEGGQPLTWHTPLTFALVLVGWGQDLQMMGQTRTNFGTITTTNGSQRSIRFGARFAF